MEVWNPLSTDQNMYYVSISKTGKELNLIHVLHEYIS